MGFSQPPGRWYSAVVNKWRRNNKLPVIRRARVNEIFLSRGRICFGSKQVQSSSLCNGISFSSVFKGLLFLKIKKLWKYNRHHTVNFKKNNENNVVIFYNKFNKYKPTKKFKDALQRLLKKSLNDKNKRKEWKKWCCSSEGEGWFMTIDTLNKLIWNYPFERFSSYPTIY